VAPEWVFCLPKGNRPSPLPYQRYDWAAGFTTGSLRGAKP